ncbi:S1/P1 nuclease [Mesorhizobium sp.]|uniref:S1/P1 nuclease n=1 Tax=Mesorhizobium sp. TaxID=1871066 RepID=UPI000FE7C9C2|nr:S1/P1 nuclease [Mesorhizobium sp.]RWO20280.1 MAG: hypothetical protein EOS09_27935 [Mesorhizobium sp.]
MNRLLIAAFLTGLSATPAAAWGPQGHSMVAMVAEARLSPETREKIRDMLLGAPLVTTGIFADEYRVGHLETSRWHYVDMPFDATAYSASRDCAVLVTGDCIIAAVEREQAIIVDPKAKVFDRADALKRLVHWVGDIHQPFHAIERDSDEGGNKVNVHFFDDTKANLHSVWDSGLIRHSGVEAEPYVKHLLDDVLPTIPEAEWKNQDTAGWALGSHDAAKGAYVDNNAVLGQEYYDVQIKVVDRQLTLAGARLAVMLEGLVERSAASAPAEAVVMPAARAAE